MASIRYGFSVAIPVYLSFEFIQDFRIVVHSPFGDWSLLHFIHLNHLQSVCSASTMIMWLTFTYEMPKRRSSNSNLKITDLSSSKIIRNFPNPPNLRGFVSPSVKLFLSLFGILVFVRLITKRLL